MRGLTQSQLLDTVEHDRRDRARFFRAARHDDLDCLSATYFTHRFPTHTHDTYVFGVVTAGCNAYRQRGELVRAGAADAFASDYVPASMIEAAWRTAAETGISLPAAVAMIAEAPARMARLTDRGRIEAGLYTSGWLRRGPRGTIPDQRIDARALARTIAEAPWTLMRAPMRLSSGTCMKRFSKMVSVMSAAPSATHISAMYWACMSVAKPG